MCSNRSQNLNLITDVTTTRSTLTNVRSDSAALEVGVLLASIIWYSWFWYDRNDDVDTKQI